MIKTIMKEFSIVLLLIIVIGLLLVIVFYDYMPTSKIVPANVVAYEMPNEIKEELTNSTVVETENIVKTYVITSTDLGAYEATDNYEKGKNNPFAISNDYKSSVVTSTNSTNNESSSNNDEAEYKGK